MAEERPKVNMDFLKFTLERKRREVESARSAVPEALLRRKAAARRPARTWRAALDGSCVRVIAEIKRTSPAAGPLADVRDPAGRAALYVRHGAAAVSVLTDRAFDGSLADLESIVDVATVPVLRKDFVIDPYQVWETRSAGADAILAIVALLDHEPLEEIVETAREAGLGVLVEIHGEDEIERALALGSAVIGVNARDLHTLEVDVDGARSTLVRLVADRPGVLAVAESGIRTTDDVQSAADAGAAAVLVGEALMRSPTPGEALTALCAVSRRREVVQ